jgi:hypothetical protein
MADFDSILKKGKGAVSSTGKPKTNWENAVGLLLYALQELNNMYGDKKAHFVQKLDKIKCSKCNDVSFTVDVCDMKNNKLVLKFHASDWKTHGTSQYLCGKCAQLP